MPSGKGPLRIAVDDWLETNPLSAWILAKWNLVKDRLAKSSTLIKTARDRNPSIAYVGTAFLTLGAWVYILTGDEGALDGIRSVADASGTDKAIEDYSRWWADMAGSVEGHPELEAIGAVFAEPILAIVGGMQRQARENPDEYMRRMYGIVAAAVLGPGILSTVAEVTGAGQIESVATVLASLVDALGIKDITGQIGSLFARAGVLADMNRSLNARFRPNRFSSSELRDLYALGEISQGAMVQELREDGWREEDIAAWIRLAFRKLGEGDVWQLYKRGEITEVQVVERLRAAGYDPEDIPLLFKINQREDVADAINVGLLTVRQGYREHVYSKADFTDALRDMAYSERDIALLVALEDKLIERKAKSLTVSQLRSAWESNVLSDPEVRHYLQVARFQDPEIDVILAEWKAEIEPKFAKLNKGTITGAYVEGILDRPTAARKLEAIGLTADDARLELDLAEVRHQDAFQAAKPKPAKTLSYSALVSLAEVGLVTPEEMVARLVEGGYTQADAELLTQSAAISMRTKARPLTQGMVEEAYVLGVLDRTRTAARLADLGFGAEDVETILLTVERANPSVFAPETVQSIRMPSVAVIVEAFRTGILTDVEYYARMAELGYTQDSASLYAVVATKEERKRTKTLTASQVAEAYERDFIKHGEAMRRLTEQGYNELDASMMLRFKKSGIEETDTWQAARAGLVSWDNAIEQLMGQGFTLEEISAAIEALPPEVSGE